MTSSMHRQTSTTVDGQLYFGEKTNTSEPLFTRLRSSVTPVVPAATPAANVVTLQASLKPVWVAMRILGVFPVQHTREGVAFFNKLSHPCKYAVFVFLFFSVCTALVTRLRLSILWETHGSFAEMIFTYLCILYCCTYWFIPIGHWVGAGKVAAYINSWARFQEHCRVSTGTHLSFTNRKQVLFWTAFTPVFSAALLIFEYLMLKVLEVWEVVYYIYINTLVMYHYVLWYLVCKALARASLFLRDAMTKELRAHVSDQTVVSKYRRLWMELCCITKATGDVLCYTYGSILLFWFTILTFSLYSFVSEKALADVNLKQIGLGLNSLLVFIFLFVLCNSAFTATDAVGDAFISHVRQLEPSNAVVQRQLEKFELLLSVSSPTISIGGYVSMGRGLLISLLSTIVTYLVVLMQFQAGAEAGTSSNPSPVSMATPPS